MRFYRLLWMGVLGLRLLNPIGAIFAAEPASAVRTFSTGANGNSITTLATLSPDGSKLAIHVYSRDAHSQQLTVYDADSGKKLYGAFTAELNGDVEIESFSPDGNRITVAQSHLNGRKELSVIQLSTGKLIYSNAYYGVEKSHFLPDGKLLDVSSDNRGLAVIDLNTKQTTAVLHPPRLVGILVSDSFSDDDQLAFVPGSSTATATIVNLQDSRVVSTLKLPDQSWQLATIFLPHTHTIRGVDGQGIIRTWDADTGKLISQLEPKHLIYLRQATFTPDGKRLVTEFGNGLQFIDAQTYEPLGFWQGPEGSQAIISTLRGDRIVVDIDRSGATLAVMRVTPQAHFHQPALPPGVSIRPQGFSPSVTTVTAIPGHTAQNLRDADWWLKRAEAECNTTTNEMVKDEVTSRLAAGYAAAGDDAAAQRMLQAAAARLAPAANQFWSPVTELRRAVAAYQVQHMVAAGHTPEAIALAKSLTTTHPPNDRVLSEVVVAQASTGDINGAIQTMGQLNKDSQDRTANSTARMLAEAGKFVDAEQIASAIPDRFWQGEAYARIAEAKAKKDDVDGAIAAAQKIQNRMNGDQQKVLAALVSVPDYAGAEKFIASLPAREQANEEGWIINDQLQRGDIAGAKASAIHLRGEEKYFFPGKIATAEIQFGQVDQAINEAKAAKLDDPIVGDILNALVKYDQPDALLDLLANLPPSRSTNYDIARLQNHYYLRAATLLAQDNRLADAQRILAQAHPQNDRYGNDDGLYTQAQWEIAAAMRRTGDRPGYQKSLQSFLNAAATATGAPSRAEAQSQLFGFYITVGDYVAAESLSQQMDPELSRGVAMSVGMALDPPPQPDQRETKPDLARTRALLQIASHTMNRPISVIMAKPAKQHLQAHAEEQWLQWAKALPTVQGRISAYMAMAEALLPVDPLADPR